MKKTVIAAAVLCLTAGTPFYSFAAAPCEVVLCMYGKATDNSGGSECRSAEKAFFNIVKKNKHGFLPNHTLNARKAFLGECPSADPESVNKILSKFGKVRG
ncbi:kikA from plasmid origin [Salmonella enterica]|uniref:KikA from plasmid origin n=1 Tax=Salmonella enterica subsp. enterica serovar Rough O:d:1,7 TaxID=1974323 RepID=A0A974QFM2_SALET|nr:TrbM/KikA/MpfK family conjugal transfer protein [Salmonella enterica]EBW8395172.1 kikA from plasmid origin [Salmonella enterica subsp. enterica serovar Florida]EDK5786688.1 kikA from plasmid origin [Salmonella enterica subsp. enterica serovar Panama]EAZ5967286.1 kikA from plasmid origin [Salmonella enterica]ECD7241494.1 kikA from plasmid origin [Salmonella enterica subsp. enterica serovar Florida]ECF4167174.1 kikA from plasmid origin [Salmonella enterica subsp. enterica serovar Florida]